MQGPRPYLVKTYNIDCPNYHIHEFIMWAPCRDTALSWSKEIHNRKDFCPLQPKQILIVTEANTEDQKRNLKTFHGYVKVEHERNKIVGSWVDSVS